MNKETTPTATLEQIMTEGRSFPAWQDRPVPKDVPQRLYDLVKLGPTSTNSCPARFVFLTTPEARTRLLPALAEGNRAKMETAPLAVVIAWDSRFYEHVPTLFPHRPGVADTYANNHGHAKETAFRNSSMQGAYMIMAARSLGLDCGPMSGFDAQKANEIMFPDGQWKVNFILNLGYGDRIALFDRQPRLPFDLACRIE